MLAMFMSAIEATIVSTAMPAIVADLGGFSLYSWVFSSYLLMNAVTILLYGKLSDLFGRKPIIIFGIVVFLAGSILCALAGSMEWLIAARFVQGLGAGAVQPVAITIIGDIYTKEERAKIQGYLASVWGVSAIMGPAIGGILVQYVSWKYVFWLNLPLGILCIFGLVYFFHEGIEKKKHQIDYLGAVLLFTSISILMVVLVEGGVNWPWSSLPVILLSLAALILFSLFVIQQKRAPEPMMPFDIWQERSILIANLTSLTTGVMLIGLSSFLPAFVQGVMEQTPIVAGFTLTAMSIGWPISSTISGRLLLKIGFRTTSVIGGVALIAGSIVFLTLSPNDGPLLAGAGSFLIGVGMGMTSTSFIVSIQSSVSWKKRGTATAANMFMRNLGSTVGAALLGGVLNSRLQAYISKNNLEDEVDVNTTNSLLNTEQRGNLNEETLAVLQDGLTNALHQVFYVLFAFALVSFILLLFLPKKE
ncbi:MDR family MFS transporter [Metabacillus arenae]|uniref:MFS transporter n=1 Tax=Metabacillus arenae TaxID=2771434 RepID=A0A926NIA7_9BACI|nr:MDR family MFS transporter [Metabacillus arenae]MBD1381285.1 MFS transporter [Metabacillus arenae]